MGKDMPGTSRTEVGGDSWRVKIDCASFAMASVQLRRSVSIKFLNISSFAAMNVERVMA